MKTLTKKYMNTNGNTLPLEKTIQHLQKTANHTAESSVPKKTKNKAIKSIGLKEKFQKKHGLYEDKNHFMIFVSTPLFEENNADLWTDLLPGISDMGFQLVIRGNASEDFKKITESFTEDHSALCTIISEEEYRQAYDVSDVLLTFSEDTKTISEVKYALSKGVIPVVAHDFPLDTVHNYNPNLETGNCFMYYKHTPWSLFATLIRAYENYRFPYDWKNICKTAIQSA